MPLAAKRGSACGGRVRARTAARIAWDFVELMNRADALGIRVIIDLVVNHSSVDCPCYQRTRADRKSYDRDWYVVG